MTAALDARLQRLKEELDSHARVGRYLRLDFERPVRSLADGYPENAISLTGNITERLLKQLWVHHGAPGTPQGKALSDLISGCRPYIRSHRVLDALHEIQRLRNRAAHDGHPVAEEDGLIAIRRLLDVLAWYTSTGSGALSRPAPRLSPPSAAKAEFLAGLYVTLDYRLARRAELSQHAVYLLLTRQRGLRTEHTELLLTRDRAEAGHVLAATAGKLMRADAGRRTRFLVLEEDDGGDPPALLPADCQIVAYDRFMGAFVDIQRHIADVAQLYPQLDVPAERIEGDLLTVDDKTGEMDVAAAGDARGLLASLAADGGNLLVIGRPGTGKTTLLKELAAEPAAPGTRWYRFFFDLTLKGRQESFADFASRTLGPYMHVEAAYVFPVFCYFIRSGSVLCALDGFDEAVPEPGLPGLLSLFTEISQVLSAESAVVMTSRVSFLEDSPQVRRLVDGTSLIPEKLAQQLHANGVDPRQIPRFSVLRLRDDPDGGSLLATQISRHCARPGCSGQSLPPPGGTRELADLLWWHVSHVADAGLLPRIVEYFGLAFLRGVAVFPMVELVNELGIGVFEAGRAEPAAFRLRELFRAADTTGTAVALRHTAYQELLAAEFLRTPHGRDTALAAAAPHPRLTEEVRQFLYRRTTVTSPAQPSSDCTVPAGVYLVGPGCHLMLRRLAQPIQIDEYPVTVRAYRQFLQAVVRDGSARWDHPAMPAQLTHQPAPGRLPVPSYYEDPAYGNHPAVGVSWWSAYAFARSRGKRLPTSLEWEAAARGFDGRLFPWGDKVDVSVVNCADSWSGRPLITYAAWREEHDRGGLTEALPTPIDAHPGNISPFGVRELGGNVWEWTSTVLENPNEAVVCGGSFDNPYRAVQASTKGCYRLRGASSVIGFRCAQELS